MEEKVYKEIMPDGTSVEFKGPPDASPEQVKAFAYSQYFKAMGKDTAASSDKLTQAERQLIIEDAAKRGLLPEEVTISPNWQKSTSGKALPVQPAGAKPAEQPRSPFDINVSELAQKLESQKKEEPYGFNVQQDLLGGGMGAAAGSALGAIPFARDVLMSGARQMGEAFRGPGGDPSAVQKWTEKMRTGEYRGGKTFKEAYQLGEGARQAPALRNPSTGETFRPSFKFAKSEIVSQPSALQQFGQGALRVATNPMVTKGLGGFGVGAGGAETMERARKKDYPGAALAATGALGSALSMTPLAPVGAPLSIGSAGGLAILDAVRNKLAEEQKQGGPKPPTAQELQEATKPAFIAPARGRRPAPTPSPVAQIYGKLLGDLDAQLQYFSEQG